MLNNDDSWYFQKNNTILDINTNNLFIMFQLYVCIVRYK